jgi:hypothetical protein
MTDGTARPEPTSAPDDELVNAVLDGEATTAEVARVAADPRLAARLDTLRAVADAVAASVPIDPATRDRQVAVAREAWIGAVVESAGHTTTGPTAPVVDLRARRRGARALGVAAAVLALALLVPAVVAVLGRSGGTTDETASRGAPSTTVVDAEAATNAGVGDDAPSGAEPAPPPSTTTPDLSGPAPTTAATVDLGDLGEVPDTTSLRARVGAALATGTSDDGTPATDAPATTAPDPDAVTDSPETPLAATSADCAESVAVAEGVSSLRARAEVTLGDEVVAVYVLDGVNGTEVLVVDPATCAVRARLPL